MPRSGELWSAAARAIDHAIAVGAQQPLITSVTHLEDDGIRFLVHRPSSLVAKAAARRAAPVTASADFDPFLPWEPDLLVAELSPTHVCLLNKYNVLDRHLLIVTRAWEDQEAALGRADLDAAARCLRADRGLVFYNAGAVAGASQRHKHLQMVPLPLAPDGPEIPTASIVAAGLAGGARLRDVPFAHAVVAVPGGGDEAWRVGADELLAIYRRLLDAVGVLAADAPPGARPAPYNLLLARGWMMVVPRRRERCGSVSINALGFAGSLFARDDAELELLRARGPLAVLREVAGRR